MDLNVKVSVRVISRDDDEKIHKLIQNVVANTKMEEKAVQLKSLFANPLPYIISSVIIIAIGVPFNLPVVAVSGGVLMSMFLYCKVKFHVYWNEVCDFLSQSTLDDISEFSDFYLSNENRTCLIAEFNEHIVGFISMREMDVEEEYPTEAEITRIFVNPECRRLGLGSQLLTELIGVASLRYKTLQVTTHETNKAGINFLKKHGFTESSSRSYTSHFPLSFKIVDYVLNIDEF
eukprot:TRINITY_DN46280_c0_g1_i1.p1 TRINITY_DN46280_c0_g1~~TRINITY_DN46280_c0_g1_i1.p1  ORF type:complete len:233 (-),score=2.82 TRINITY_DN46280_c0_g1_i1:14-712(-)